MDDYEQVRQLLARYAHALDAEDADGVAALFSEEGVFDLGDQHFEGRAAIAEMFHRFAAAGALAHTRHLTLNSVISLDGTTGVATSDWIAIRATTGDWAVIAAGRYNDELVRHQGWSFRRREDLIYGPIPPDAAAASGR
jgi:ketosteroid isomerase-like protein